METQRNLNLTIENKSQCRNSDMSPKSFFTVFSIILILSKELTQLNMNLTNLYFYENDVDL